MPNDQNSSQGRRPHYHRGRRGSDRRHTERRTPPPGPEQANRDHVDVEQIMRDIRARISSRHGIDLSPQQIQELAARRLDAILEPRHVKPALLEQMRRAAGEAIEVPTPTPAAVAPFDESELYVSHRGFLNTLRRWLNPILKLFFNPAPIARALSAQAAHSNAAAAREAELYTRQAEWNALHYEIVQRLVTELARSTLETQNLFLRMEALDAKLDFNERRVRAMELAQHNRPVTRGPERTAERTAERTTERIGESASTDPGTVAAATTPAPNGETGSEGARRRRRRRRGRRSGFGGQEGSASAPSSPTTGAAGADIDSDSDADEEDLQTDAEQPALTSDAGGSAALEPAHHFSLLQPEERYPSGESMTVSPAGAADAPSDVRTNEAVHPSPDSGGGDITPASDDHTGPEPSER